MSATDDARKRYRREMAAKPAPAPPLAVEQRLCGFTFHPDGTASYDGHFGWSATAGDMLTAARGAGLPRSPVLEVTWTDTRMNKPTVGRAVATIFTGGLALLTPGRTGEVIVTIVTADWARTCSSGDLARLFAAALQAKARAGAGGGMGRP